MPRYTRAMNDTGSRVNLLSVCATETCISITRAIRFNRMHTGLVVVEHFRYCILHNLTLKTDLCDKICTMFTKLFPQNQNWCGVLKLFYTTFLRTFLQTPYHSLCCPQGVSDKDLKKSDKNSVKNYIRTNNCKKFGSVRFCFWKKWNTFILYSKGTHCIDQKWQ